MGNNPISNNDPLGDTSIFYNASGNELLRTTENNKSLGNVVSIISDEKLNAFNDYVSIISADGGNLNEDCSVKLLRSQGESYDTKSVFDFVDANANNFSTDKNFAPIDGKGPLVNETSAALEKKNGVWTVNPDKTDNTPPSSFSSSKVRGDGDVTMHTHDNEGRTFQETGGEKRRGTVESGPASVGDDNSKIKRGSAILEMAAGKKSIYFYNSSGVILTINRDAFSPKYFQKK